MRIRIRNTDLQQSWADATLQRYDTKQLSPVAVLLNIVSKLHLDSQNMYNYTIIQCIHFRTMICFVFYQV